VLWVLNHISAAAWTSTDDVAWLYVQSEGGGTEQRLSDVERFVSQLVLQPLLWMGLVEVARMPEDGGTVFRLSARGKRLIREGRPRTSMNTLFRDDENLIVQSNLEVFTPVGCPPSDRVVSRPVRRPGEGPVPPEHAKPVPRFRQRGDGRADAGLPAGALPQRHSPERALHALRCGQQTRAHPGRPPAAPGEDGGRHPGQGAEPGAGAAQVLAVRPSAPCLLLIAPNVAAEKVVEELRRLGYMPRVRWDSVVGEHETQLDLTHDEVKAVLSLIRAFELTDKVNARLADWLLAVDEELSPERRLLKQAIVQGDLGDSYRKLEELDRVLRPR
jgi:hypothetical protein